jgi:hypothetical protein
MHMATAKQASRFTKMERHPLSEKYGPSMSEEELKGLGLDIKANGQHDDIIEHEGKILAGWNRYMACLQQGVDPRIKPKDPKSDPVAVAFGTNFVRRKLGSVQKAFFGAQFCVDTGAKQTEVAKLVGCNMNRLNLCCQLLKRDDKEAKKAIDNLRDNSEISSATFDEMMLELGLRDEPKPREAPLRTNTHSGDDDDGLGGDDFGGGGDDDLTGGAIDGLLGGDDDESHGDTGEPGTTRKRKEVGEGADPLPPVGGKASTQTRPNETGPSRLAKAFRQMEAGDQMAFVQFAWGKLQQALNAAINAGKVTYHAPDGTTSPGTQAMDAGKQAKADKAAAKKAGKAPPASDKPDPSLIARGKPAATEDDEHDDLLAGKGDTPGAEVGSPFKTSAHDEKAAPAKKGAAKKAPAKAPAKAAAKAPAKKAAAKSKK